MVEQWNRYGGTGNNDGGTVEKIFWNSGTVMWNSETEMVEECNNDGGTGE